MSSLATRFVTRIHKQVASAQRETTSNSEGPDGKRPKGSRHRGLEESGSDYYGLSKTST